LFRAAGGDVDSPIAHRSFDAVTGGRHGGQRAPSVGDRIVRLDFVVSYAATLAADDENLLTEHRCSETPARRW
jgi:hypothetical protein